MSWLFSFFFYFIHFTTIFTFAENAFGRFDQGFPRRETGTNFIEHFHRVLNVRANVSITTFDGMACGLECVRHSFCVSFNFADNSPGSRGVCEMLSEDKYTSSDRFEPSQFYHHYSIASPCEYRPCKNGARCRPLYGSNGFMCERIPGSIEQGAPWIKLNSDDVCFGAKDDAYGNFTVTSNGTVVTLKLVYISGFVTCDKINCPFGSHWACKKGSNIATIVTNAKNQTIFPQNYQNMAYLLPGYHANSSELVFNPLSPPLRVTAGDEYRVWYHEDFKDGAEADNDGHTCIDVYALIM